MTTASHIPPDSGSKAVAPLLGPLAMGLLGLAFFGLVSAVAWNLAVPSPDQTTPPTLLDFQVFHIAGQLAWQGDLATAYHSDRFWPYTRALTHSPDRMFWPYPPHFNMVAALLALMPLWLSYVVFTGGSLLGYALALRRLAGAQYGLVLALLLPAIMINIRIGQNSLLIGALAAWFASLALTGRTLAGVPLGLLTVKPQFLPGIGLYLLLRGQWRIIIAGGLVAMLALGTATLLLGVGVWRDWLNVTGEIGGFLFEGVYQYHRMTSLFAVLFVLSGDPHLAMAVQIGFAAVLALGLLVASRRGWPPRQLLAAAIMASMLMSPYGYDYDLPVIGAAIALLVPDLVLRGQHIWLWLLPLSWLTCLAGVITNLAFPAPPLPAVAFGPVLLLCAALLASARHSSAMLVPSTGA